MINQFGICMKSGVLLTVLLLAAGCESKQAQSLPSDKDLIPVHPPLTGVTFSGGDGSSIENAVIIKAPNNFVGVRAEYDWIKKNHPNWRLETQSVLKGSGKIYDKMIFSTPDGQQTTLFFDISDFFGKL